MGNVNIPSFDSLNFPDGMEGTEEDMKECLLLFSCILFPEISGCLRSFIQNNYPVDGQNGIHTDGNTYI